MRGLYRFGTWKDTLITKLNKEGMDHMWEVGRNFWYTATSNLRGNNSIFFQPNEGLYYDEN